MTAFVDLDWSRIDITAILTYGGQATIEERRHQACRDWLLRQGYHIDTFDCRPGLAVAIPELGRLLKWEQQFGYQLGPLCNLNALRDGFNFPTPNTDRRVFEVIRADLAWEENSQWVCGLLSIAREYSRHELALGRRFFVLLVVPERSPLVWTVIEEIKVPAPYWSPCREVHEFLR